MPSFSVETAQRAYHAIVERGGLQRLPEFIPEGAGKLFLLTEEDVWDLHGSSVEGLFPPGALHVLLFPGGEVNKRLSVVESLATQMTELGADRTSVVICFGGGIVTDIGGFLAAAFMRGIRVVQVPTTLLAQVDAAVGGKTGVNLVNGKNLFGSFHQPLAVLIDPDVLATLPPREFRAGLFEIVKCGVIRDPALFETLETRSDDILAMNEDVLDEAVAAAVRIKAEVVSEDEREGDLRRILNFGHTIGHAIEAETEYTRFLHGEAVAWGMLAATRIAELRGMMPSREALRIAQTICRYGPLQPAANLDPDHLVRRLASDKKTLQGKIHFVLPIAIGEVRIVSGIEPALVRQAILDTLRRPI
jgi:3-dehydroquinate synthase